MGEANYYRAFSFRAQGNDVDFTTEAERKLQASLPAEFREVK